MKKLLFSALFLSTFALGFSSCMNGDYDAQPLTANSTKNPIKTEDKNGNNGSNVGIASKGQVRCVVSGSGNFVSASGSNYMLVGPTDRLISGGEQKTTVFKTLNLLISGYSGPGTYTCSGTSATSTYGSYAVNDLATATKETFNSATSTPQGSGSIIVTSDDNDVMVGTFTFTAYSDLDGSKSVTVTSGSFNVPKF